MTFVKAFAISLFVFLILDGVWLGLIMKDFNTRELSPIARMKDGALQVSLLPALLTYLVMAVAITGLVVPFLGDELFVFVARGALLGLCLYGIFDLTNLAIVRDYPVAFACVDIAWGVVQYSICAAVLWFARAWLV